VVITEVGLGNDLILFNSNFFSAYMILDPSVTDQDNIFGFPRPLENIELPEHKENKVPLIGSFGFATEGKEWHKVVELVQKDFNKAIIRFNIPKATFVPKEFHEQNIRNMLEIIDKIKKPEIKIILTHDQLSKEDLIKWCSENTINIFYYNRQHIFKTGLSAVTDQAISSGRPLLVTSDKTFRHIHKYIDFYPNISVKQAIDQTIEGVNKMKKDWSKENFLTKFESILKKFI
jgi:hypothetical protein